MAVFPVPLPPMYNWSDYQSLTNRKEAYKPTVKWWLSFLFPCLLCTIGQISSHWPIGRRLTNQMGYDGRLPCSLPSYVQLVKLLVTNQWEQVTNMKMSRHGHWTSDANLLGLLWLVHRAQVANMKLLYSTGKVYLLSCDWSYKKIRKPIGSQQLR